MQQFTFDLQFYENYKSEDYLVCKSNIEIFSFIHKWPDWGVRSIDKVITLHGHRESGKTHLSHIWKKISNAKFITYNDLYLEKTNNILIANNCFIIDDIENFLSIETNLLHFINMVTQHNKYLMITSQNHPRDLPIHIADLKSRLISFLEFKIPEIDDELLKLIAFKFFSDRHLAVSDKVLNYMFTRIDRSFTSLKQIINMIDKKALVEKRNISINLVRQILENL